MTEGVTLAFHKADAAADGTAAEHSPAGRCRPGFGVANLAEFHQRMTQNEVPCIQEPQTVFGAMIGQYADPDGLFISVSENCR